MIRSANKPDFPSTASFPDHGFPPSRLCPPQTQIIVNKHRSESVPVPLASNTPHHQILR